MSKKLKWNYTLNGNSYDGNVEQELVAVDTDGNTVDLGVTLDGTDREAVIDAPSQAVTITLKSAKLGASAEKSVDYNPNIAYNYSPSGDVGWLIVLSANGDYTNIVKGGKAFVYLKGVLYYKNPYGYESTRNIEFAHDGGSANLVYVTVGNAEEVAMQSDDGCLFTFENITEDTAIQFRLPYTVYNVINGDLTAGTQYNAYLTVNVTVSEEASSELELEMTREQYVNKDETTVVKYVLKYNGKQVLPTSVQLKGEKGTKVMYSDDADLTINKINLTYAALSEIAKAKGYNYLIDENITVTFTYNGADISQTIRIATNKLKISLVNASTDFQNLTIGVLPNTFKWEVIYGDTVIDDAVNTNLSFVDAYTQEQYKNGYLSDYYEENNTNYWWLNGKYIQTSKGDGTVGMSYNLNGTGRELSTTVRRELDPATYLENTNVEYGCWSNVFSKNNPRNLYFNITVNYRGQTVSLLDYNTNILYLNYNQVCPDYEITYNNLDNILNCYFDYFPTVSMFGSDDIETELDCSFTIAWHYAYMGSIDVNVTLQKLTVQKYIDGTEVKYGYGEEDSDEYPLIYDSSDLSGTNTFDFSTREKLISFMGIGTYKVTIEATTVNSDGDTVSSSITKEIEVVEDDGGTLSIDLGTDYAENLSENAVPRYTVVPVYTATDGTEKRISIGDNNIFSAKYYSETGNGIIPGTGAYYNNLTKDTAGASIEFDINYRGKTSTITHTPTWK